MSNRVRYFMAEEVKAILPLLHKTYHAIGRFQKDRSADNQAVLETCLHEAGRRLQVFKPVMQPSKQDYFDAISREELSISDRIVALDTAVGSLHIEFSVPRMYMHQESKELREALEQIRIDKAEQRAIPSGEALCTGIAASPGVASGKAKLVRKRSDYKHIQDGAILVAEMTRPELVYGLGKVAAIVTDVGGMLCHAAIVAREKEIPCVVGTKDATKVLKNRMLIEVDGTRGLVRPARHRHDPLL